jgi:hypothetical protein
VAPIVKGNTLRRITSVSVGCITDTEDGPAETTISLADIVRCCRHERVEDLLDDLAMLCEDVEARGRAVVRPV